MLKFLIGLFLAGTPLIHIDGDHHYHLAGPYAGQCFHGQESHKFHIVDVLLAHPELRNKRTEKAAASQLVLEARAAQYNLKEIH